MGEPAASSLLEEDGDELVCDSHGGISHVKVGQGSDAASSVHGEADVAVKPGADAKPPDSKNAKSTGGTKNGSVEGGIPSQSL